MINHNLVKILEKVNYNILNGSLKNDDIINNISFDTRKLCEGDLFVCIKGSINDSHKFLSNILNCKPKAIIVESNNEYVKDLLLNNYINNDTCIIETYDTRIALSLISISYFNNDYNTLKVIGITGTKGKTTTSFMIKKILENAGYKVGLIGTVGCFTINNFYETENTTPESYYIQKYIYEMKEANVDYIVMEVSSQSLKLNRVYGMKFLYAIFTNIFEDHIGKNEHKDYNEYLQCKISIMNYAKSLILNKNINNYNDIIKYAKTNNINVVLFSLDEVSNLELVKKDKNFGVEFKYLDNSFYLSIPGRHNVDNAITAITVLKCLNIDINVIKKTFENIIIPGRNEVVYTDNNVSIIVDYAHNAVGTIALLTCFKEYKFKRMVVLFGCGGNRDKLRRYGMGDAVSKYADFSVITADNSRYEKTIDIINDILSTFNKTNENYVVIEDRRDAINYVVKNRKKGDLILVIGKGHETYNDFNGKKTYFSDREEILKAIDLYG